MLNVYDRISQWFMDNRSLDLFEKTCLDRVIVRLSSKVDILDCGCGMGDPIAKYFMDKDVVVTGVDGCAKLTEFAKYHLENGTFLLHDIARIVFV